jgi:hypothetical protein
MVKLIAKLVRPVLAAANRAHTRATASLAPRSWFELPVNPRWGCERPQFAPAYVIVPHRPKKRY